MDRKRDVQVGLVVVLGVLAGVAGTIWLQGGWGQQGTQVLAASTNVGQLMRGASVKFRGVEVGEVEEVSLAPGGEAVLIRMTLQPDLVIPANSAVLLSPESMFGDWQAEIIDRADFPRQVFLQLPDREGVLPGAALPDVSRLTAAADNIAHNLTTISERIQIAFTEETALNIRRAIDNIGELSDGLSEIIDQQADRFNDLAQGVNASAAELGVAAQVARRSFERIDSILAGPEVGNLISEAEESVGNLKNITEDLGGSLVDLRSAARRADSTFARMERLVTAVEAGEGSVGRLLSDPALADGAMGAVAELQALLADIKENPGRYVRLSIF